MAQDTDEQALLSLINAYRAANGVAELSLDDTLTGSARWMSTDMAAKDYWPNEEYCAQFSLHAHCDSLGRDAPRRIEGLGYTYNTWKGEYLAPGMESAQADIRRTLTMRLGG